MSRRYHPYRQRGGAPFASLPTLLRRKVRQATRAHAKLDSRHRLRISLLRSWTMDAFEITCERCYIESLHPPVWRDKSFYISLGTTRSLALVTGLELCRSGISRLPRPWTRRRPR